MPNLSFEKSKGSVPIAPPFVDKHHYQENKLNKMLNL
jgi:hypothetical protein